MKLAKTAAARKRTTQHTGNTTGDETNDGDGPDVESPDAAMAHKPSPANSLGLGQPGLQFSNSLLPPAPSTSVDPIRSDSDSEDNEDNGATQLFGEDDGEQQKNNVLRSSSEDDMFGISDDD